MKKIFLTLILSFIFIVTGCSCSPTYYTKSEVESIVKETFGNEFKLKSTNTFTDDSKEKNKVYEYIYVNDEGFEFSVYSSTGHVGIDDSTTNFYNKSLSMNYLSNMIKYKSKDLQKIFDGLSFKTEVNGEYIYFYLNDLNKIDEAADAIIKIDKLFNFNYKKNNSYIGVIRVELYYIPTGNIDDKKYIASEHLSYNDSTRLNLNSVKEDLHNSALKFNN